MRGSPIKLVVAAGLAAALLTACTSSPQAGSSSPGGPTASSETSTGKPAVPPGSAVTRSVTSAPSVTVPPVTVPPVSGQITAPTPLTTASSSTSVPSSTRSTASSNTPSTSSTTTSSKASSSAPPPVVVQPVSFTASPKLGSDGLSPRTPITLQAAHGTLADVVLTNAEGHSVKGALNAARTSWTLGEPLGYGGTYTLAGDAVGSNGKKVKISGSYGTTNPDGVIGASIFPSNGKTVGIAAPIMISLDSDIDDTVGRQNIEKAITITTVPKTAGSFAWIRHDNGWGLDWRPQSYWKPGTKVTVTANLYGVDYGNNIYGEKDLTSTFTIGRSEITKADIKSHRLKVYRDGKLLFDFPTSYGLESDPGRVTRGGTYIVMRKEYLHLMSNPKYHYFNFKAYYAVRISNNGTFIHTNDGTADVQGKQNLTHGCANLTTKNAKAFYDQTMYGDPVEVTNSSIPMSESDGDVYDWSIPWDKWQTMSALSKSYAG